MADTPADKQSVFQPFSDIVGGQRDEGYVNLASDISKKLTMPTGVFSNATLVFNASTGKFEVGKQPYTSYATVSSATLITNVTADVVGMTLTLTDPGRYLLCTSIDTFFQTAAAGTMVTYTLVTTAGTLVYGAGIMRSDAGAFRSTVPMNGTLSITDTATVKVQCIKAPNTAAISYDVNSSFIATYLGKN